MTDLLITTGRELVRVAGIERDPRAEVIFDNREASSLAVDPAGGSIMVGTHGQGVWRSIDAGHGWEDLRLPEPDVFSVAISAADGTFYAGCEPSMLFRSPDGGESWEELEALRALPSAPRWSFPPRPWTSHVRWIAPHPLDAGRLLCGIELGGLMYSDDGGLSWQDHRPGAQPDVHALAWHPSGRRAYEAGGGGAAFSDDGGWSWQPCDDGRDRHYCWALACDPVDPGRWYVSANPGPGLAHGSSPAQARIYVRSGESSWRPLTRGLPDPLPSMPYALAAAGSRLYCGLADGSLWIGEDRGESWHPLSPHGPGLRAVHALTVLESE